MKTLGLDIGTTTISAVVAEEGAVISCVTCKNDSFIPTENDWERIQDSGYHFPYAMRPDDRLVFPAVVFAGHGGAGYPLPFLANPYVCQLFHQ